MKPLRSCDEAIKMSYSVLVMVLFHCGGLHVMAYEQCSAGTGGGICPDFNTCCLRHDGSSGCIAKDMGPYNASCCDDGETGCAVGYSCRRAESDCLASRITNFTDPLVQILPRYRLCNARDIEKIHGLSIVPGADLAYYSSLGPIENISATTPDMAFIFIHGAGRNADDYFCAASASVELQKSYSKVLLITPLFYSEADKRDKSSFLFWENQANGAWRYGAESLAPSKLSSFAALDKLVETIWTTFPALQKVVVAGHSSGGQMVQRWSLLTSSWVSGDRMHSVVANPSSFVYLTPLRFIQDDWSRPSDDEAGSCPQYNQWEWGLDQGGDMEFSYRDSALANVTAVVDRFKKRQVIYLAGSQDRCNVSHQGWCHSHGLETTCMDQLQGTNRFERSARYVSSLRMLGFWTNHDRRIVNNVGHDHALMFQSPEGLDAVFGAPTA